MRVFIAIPIAQNIQENITKLLTDNKQGIEADVDGRLVYVEPSIYHLTVKFCGNIEVGDLEKLKQIIADITMLHDPMQLETNQIVGIPHHTPRIIALSVRQNPTYNALQKALSDALDESGLLDVKFTGHKQPHVTLARIKGASHLDNVLPIDSHDMIEVQELVLYSSELTPQGPQYTELATFKLL